LTSTFVAGVDVPEHHRGHDGILCAAAVGERGVDPVAAGGHHAVLRRLTLLGDRGPWRRLRLGRYELLAAKMRQAKGKVIVSLNDHPDVRRCYDDAWPSAVVDRRLTFL
jgi:hypothetical protein